MKAIREKPNTKSMLPALTAFFCEEMIKALTEHASDEVDLCRSEHFFSVRR